MIQTYTFIAIVGFSLAGVLALTAVALFFALHIRQVRDDLTGRTAARSIAEIRSRAKTRARREPRAAVRLGWEHEPSSGDLEGFARAGDTPAAREAPEEAGTTVFAAAPEGTASAVSPGIPAEEGTAVFVAAPETEEGSTEVLSSADDTGAGGRSAGIGGAAEKPGPKPRAGGAR